jgi:hypothetical protein
MDDVLSLCRHVRRRLRHVAGVIGVGFGLKRTAGVITPEKAWRVYVDAKLPNRDLATSARVPPDLDGCPTDVISRAPARVVSAAASARELTDNLLVDGGMIANKNGVPGTLGCRAWLDATDQPVVLGSHHVLLGKKAQAGDLVWRVCAGPVEARYVAIARLHGGKAGIVDYGGDRYFVDAATAAIDPLIAEFESEVPSGPAALAVLGSLVSKIGAATGRTAGRIVDICYPDRWFSECESLDAPNQLLIAPTATSDGPGEHVFCRTGDSGSVVRDGCGSVVGLLWGSNARGEGVACHIAPVMDALAIRLESARMAEARA